MNDSTELLDQFSNYWVFTGPEFLGKQYQPNDYIEEWPDERSAKILSQVNVAEQPRLGTDLIPQFLTTSYLKAEA